jgi:DNA-binding MarR family transcriptional regulator
VERDERISILEALAEAIAEPGGAAALDIDVLSARVGVSRKAFERQFADPEAALLAAFDLAVERAAAAAVPAFEGESRWLDAIRAALGASLRFAEAEPALARLIVVHAMGGGPRVLARRMEVLGAVAAAVDRARLEMPPGRRAPPAVIAEGVVGAVLAVLANRLLSEPARSPIELFGTLSSIIVLPYLGPSVARRELSRPLPRPRAEQEAPPVPERLDGAAKPRLTYRTARVLSAIEDYPGASNREVAQRAGILDQGQISKLLGRLEQRELIARIGEARVRGEANAWRLTEEGRAAVRSAGVRAALAAPQPEGRPQDRAEA